MVIIKDNKWEKIIVSHLPLNLRRPFPKLQQQALALALQKWVALSIEDSLRTVAKDPNLRLVGEWSINFKGKKFVGAVRQQEVDVWLSNSHAGLLLAVDPKHFQSRDSLQKNWKNGHNDLVAFATNLHERFPMCAVGGFISFPLNTATQAILHQMKGICERSIPREKPLNAYGKFEGFGLAIYNEKGRLIWPFEPDSQLKPALAFRSLANALFSRTLAVLP
jgi:hypothetical protein